MIITISGGWAGPATAWITVSGEVYLDDQRSTGELLRASGQTEPAIFKELLKAALTARETTRKWREAHADRRIDTVDAMLEWMEQGRPGGGICEANFDGVDTSVILIIDGEEELHECVGGEWDEFRRRFFEVVDAAIKLRAPKSVGSSPVQ